MRRLAARRDRDKKQPRDGEPEASATDGERQREWAVEASAEAETPSFMVPRLQWHAGEEMVELMKTPMVELEVELAMTPMEGEMAIK